jgi:hypothetical protein
MWLGIVVIIIVVVIGILLLTQRKTKLPSMSLGFGKFLELDVKKKELATIKYKLVGKPKVLDRMPFSQIDGVRIYKIWADKAEDFVTGAMSLVSGQLPRGSEEPYILELMIEGSWHEWGRHENRNEALRMASAIGRILEKPEVKLSGLVDNLPNITVKGFTIANEALPSNERYRIFSSPIKLKCRTPVQAKLLKFRKKWRVFGVIWTQDYPIDSVEVLFSDDSESISGHYILVYTVHGKVVPSVWTKRKFNIGFGLKKVTWKGGPLAEKLNSDAVLQELLRAHLEKVKCELCITTDKSMGNMLIIFCESYPRHWIKLPEEMYPSEERIELVTKFAEYIRSS